MKNLCLAVSCFIISLPGVVAQSNYQGTFYLTVDLQKIKILPKTLVFRYSLGIGSLQRTKSDTVAVKGRRLLHLTGATDEPIKPAAILLIQKIQLASSLNFYLQEGKMTIVSDTVFSSAKVKGPFEEQLSSLKNNEYAAKTAFYNSLSEAEKQIGADDEQAYLRLMGKTEKSNDRILDSIYKPYVRQHANDNPVSIVALEAFAGDSMILIRSNALDELDSLYQQLKPDWKTTPTAATVKQRIDAAKKVAIGRSAPGFSQPDTAGMIVKLSDYLGRYVLVDFWASWCHWCRAQNPHLKSLFHQYHNRGLNLLGVSLDNKEADKAWRKAIEKDGTYLWEQVCEFSDSNDANSAAGPYGIRAIPQNFLIDPAGKIIAVNLNGADLDEKMKTIFPD